MPTLFPFADYWWFYALFTLGVLGLLALDLGVFHRDAHEVKVKEALMWSIVWISLALLFCWGFWQYAHWKLPQDPRLLAAGITPGGGRRPGGPRGPGVSRGLRDREVALGGQHFRVRRGLQLLCHSFEVSAPGLVLRHHRCAPLSRHLHRPRLLLLQWQWVIWFFGAFLVLTGIKIIFSPEKPLDPERNPIIRLLRRLLPVTPQVQGERFLVRQGGMLHGTPLLVSLVFIEVTDFVFAVDSVPAIFAITSEPLIVFTSNVFAILGLRALFFLLAGAMHRFRYLKYGLGLILVFVGLKMAWLNDAFGGKFPIAWSLGIIGAILGTTVAASLVLSRPGARVPARLPASP
jgi:tellurite resistance protein TerC